MSNELITFDHLKNTVSRIANIIDNSGSSGAGNYVTQSEFVKLTVPAQDGTLTYNGATQSPCWLHYDSSKMTIGGTISAVNAGEYSATFTPKTNFTWQDGSTTTQTVTWNIQRAASLIQFPVAEINELNALTRDYKISVIGDGAVSVTNSNDTVGDAQFNPLTNILTLAPAGVGNATLTINIAQTLNFNAASLVIPVTFSKPLDIYTKVFLKGEDSVFADECGNEAIDNGSVPMQLDSNIKKFGSASIFMETVNSSFKIENLTLGGQPFTVDFWFYFNPSGGHNTSQAAIFDIADYDTDFLLINFFSIRTYYAYFVVANPTVRENSNYPIPINQWVHIAIVYDGTSTVKWFFDGVLTRTYTNCAIPRRSNLTVHFSYPTYNTYESRIDYPNNHYDNFRISDGIARWSDNFTPPQSDIDYYVTN